MDSSSHLTEVDGENKSHDQDQWTSIQENIKGWKHDIRENWGKYFLMAAKGVAECSECVLCRQWWKTKRIFKKMGRWKEKGRRWLMASANNKERSWTSKKYSSVHNRRYGS